MSLELNESNFNDEVKMSKGVTVVDFFTTWCGPCRFIAPILEQLTGAKVVKVDGEKCPGLVDQNNISAYPTIIFFKDGVEMQRRRGVTSQVEMQKIINELQD